ncbi:hypothetical protein [Paenarthrobacter sp. AMU7]|uniref:Uncharacterized protein n=1 Tax=Paenarthrobacter sp. AMU7 TaxID=3162492 RepID=A0AB39YI87_9MICC
MNTTVGFLDPDDEFRREMQAALAPAMEAMRAHIQAAASIQAMQAEVAKAMAPALAAIQESLIPTLTAFAAAATAANLATQLPDLSVLAHFGELVANGEIDPEFVQAAHNAVDGVKGYREEIADFSVRSTLAQVFDAKVIADGVYIFVFIAWLVGSLWVAGLSAEAKAISDAVGLSSAAGSHIVAKEVTSKTMRIVIKKRNTRRR